MDLRARSSVVLCASGRIVVGITVSRVRHRHGASPDPSMSHITIQEALNGSPVTWMEHVIDDQYLAGTRGE
jgi:hypothetical protein